MTINYHGPASVANAAAHGKISEQPAGRAKNRDFSGFETTMVGAGAAFPIFLAAVAY
jgi:hypothetical protein